MAQLKPCQTCGGGGSILVKVTKNGHRGDAVPVLVSQKCGTCDGKGTVEAKD